MEEVNRKDAEHGLHPIVYYNLLEDTETTSDIFINNAYGSYHA